MKKTDLLKVEDFEKKAARFSVLLGSIFFCHLVIFLITKLIIQPFVYPVLQDEATKGLIETIHIFLWIVLPIVFFYSVALRRNWPARLYAHMQRIRQRQKDELERKMLDLRQKEKKLLEELKELYVAEKISCSGQQFAFVIDLSGDLLQQEAGRKVYITPQVSVNGIAVAVKVLDTRKLLCFARRAITAKEPMLAFTVGAETRMIHNPYFMKFDCPTPIVWQCEGHGNERNIFIPAEYFPNAMEGIGYPFALKVHKTFFGNFTGRYNAGMDCVIIPLRKEVHKSDCKGKDAVLSLLWGDEEKIKLPCPVLLVRDGRPV